MRAHKKDQDKETIHIGSEPLLRYVMASMAVFLRKDLEKIRLVVRGDAISRAVAAAEVLRKDYLPHILDVEDVQIGSDTIADKTNDGKDRVSYINIILRKVGGFQAERSKQEMA